MIEYKSKYFTKAKSVYGEANYSLINKLNKVIGINEKFNVLVPNCNDGLYIIPLLKFTKNIDCYEENKVLINGGNIDDFISLGLRARLEGKAKNNNVKIFKSNYYNSLSSKKYNLILAIRTIQLKENDLYTISQKLEKLMSSVKKEGYLYLQYYIGNDIEVSDEQTITYNMIKKIINLNEWTILYYRDNNVRNTHHGLHPFNKKSHTHKIGSMLLQRKKIYGETIKEKRRCNRTFKTKSVYGEANQQVYDYIEFLDSTFKRNCNVLVVDAKDGQNVVPFAKKGFNVVCYETDKKMLNGGIINNQLVQGLNKRVNDYSLNNQVIIKDNNFYENKEIKKFDFVYVEDSLNLSKYKNITLKKKVRRLMSTVKEGGYLYIYYDMAVIEEDYITYSPNLYFRTNEIQSYFDLEDWKIVYTCERLSENKNYNHYNQERRVGYLLAMKVRNRRKYKYHYSVEINNEIKC